MKQKNMRLAGILACLLALSCAGCGVQGGLPDGSAAGEPQQSAGETSAAGAAQEAGKNGRRPPSVQRLLGVPGDGAAGGH